MTKNNTSRASAANEQRQLGKKERKSDSREGQSLTTANCSWQKLELNDNDRDARHLSTSTGVPVIFQSKLNLSACLTGERNILKRVLCGTE